MNKVPLANFLNNLLKSHNPNTNPLILTASNLLERIPGRVKHNNILFFFLSFKVGIPIYFIPDSIDELINIGLKLLQI